MFDAHKKHTAVAVMSRTSTHPPAHSGLPNMVEYLFELLWLLPPLCSMASKTVCMVIRMVHLVHLFLKESQKAGGAARVFCGWQLINASQAAAAEPELISSVGWLSIKT